MSSSTNQIEIPEKLEKELCARNYAVLRCCSAAVRGEKPDKGRIENEELRMKNRRSLIRKL